MNLETGCYLSKIASAQKTMVLKRPALDYMFRHKNMDISILELDMSGVSSFPFPLHFPFSFPFPFSLFFSLSFSFSFSAASTVRHRARNISMRLVRRHRLGHEQSKLAKFINKRLLNKIASEQKTMVLEHLASQYFLGTERSLASGGVTSDQFPT